MDHVPQAAALTIVASISPRWGSRRDIVALVGRSPEGLVAAYRDIADVLCIDDRWAHTLLKDLVASRVLDVVEEAAGRRARRYALNPRLGDWRDVPWKTSVELVWFRAFHDELVGDSGDNVRSAALKDRGTSAVVPRSRTAALPKPDRLVPRSSTAALAEACAALLHRGAIGGVTSNEVPPSVGGDDSGSVVHSGRSERVEPRLAALKEAARRHNGWRFCRGRPADHLDELAAAYGYDAVHAKIPTVPRDPDPMRWVDTLAGVLAPQPDIELEAPAEPEITRPVEYVPDQPAELGDRVAGLAAARAAKAAAADVAPPCDTGLVAVGGSS